MNRYTTYRATNFPTTYLVMEVEAQPQKVVPFNLLYLLGELVPVKIDISPSYLPFAKGGRDRISKAVASIGYCFYKWPGKILEDSLGDILEIDEEA